MFTIITDDPPPEIAEAGHDHYPILIEPGSIDAWLNPEVHSLDVVSAIFEDKPLPFYAHR